MNKTRVRLAELALRLTSGPINNGRQINQCRQRKNPEGFLIVPFVPFLYPPAVRRCGTAALVVALAVATSFCAGSQAGQQSEGAPAGGRGRGGGGEGGPVPVTIAMVVEKPMPISPSGFDTDRPALGRCGLRRA